MYVWGDFFPPDVALTAFSAALEGSTTNTLPRVGGLQQEGRGPVGQVELHMCNLGNKIEHNDVMCEHLQPSASYFASQRCKPSSDPIIEKIH